MCCAQQGMSCLRGVRVCVGVCVPTLRAQSLHVHSSRNTQQCLPLQVLVVMWSPAVNCASLRLLAHPGMTVWLVDNVA